MRVFSKNFVSTTPTILVAVVNVFIAPEDPSFVFVSELEDSIASVPIDNDTPAGDEAGSLLTDAFAQPIGPMVAVLLSYTQNATQGESKIGISVDIVARSNLDQRVPAFLGGGRGLAAAVRAGSPPSDGYLSALGGAAAEGPTKRYRVARETPSVLAMSGGAFFGSL